MLRFQIIRKTVAATIFAATVAIFIPCVAHCQTLSRSELLGLENIENKEGWEMHKKMWVQSETIKAFKKMRRAAFWKAGIKLKIVSAYRGFDRQKTIWERKWNDSTRMALAEDSLQRAISILEYSSMPGTSRHHWGTDIDINSVENEYFETRRGKKIYKWLSENAEHFGFFQPYTAGRAKGYKEEPWHWSYRVVAEQYYTEYLNSIQCTDINGFQGCETATTLDVIEGWVKP